MSIINQVPDGKDPFSVCLISTDCTTTSGIAHRVLEDNGHSDILLQYMENALQRHHISPEALQRHMDLIASLKIENLPIPRSPYPQTSLRKEILRKFSWRNIWFLQPIWSFPYIG